MTEVYIGLGSNQDQPVNQLNSALEHIDAISGTSLKKVSSFYRSKPVGPQDQPDFINAVALIETELPARTLLIKLQEIENRQNRKRSVHWGPRTIDLDILLYGNQVINDKELTIPHRYMHTRGFVLYPLSELAPELDIPGHGNIGNLLKDICIDDLKQVCPDG